LSENIEQRRELEKFKRREAQQKQDAELAEDRDKIREGEVLELKDKFPNHDATRQRALQDHISRADQHQQK